MGKPVLYIQVNGASEEEMNELLAKATAGELSQKEVDDIVGKALTNRQVDSNKSVERLRETIRWHMT